MSYICNYKHPLTHATANPMKVPTPLTRLAGLLFRSLLLGSLLFAFIRLGKQEDYLAIHSRHFVLAEFALTWLLSLATAIACDFWVSLSTRRRFSPAIEFTAVALFAAACVLIVMTASHAIEHTPVRTPELILPMTVCVLFTCAYYSWTRALERDRRLMAQALKLEKMHSRQLDTELRLLRSQYHPHFLFNILNTVYFQIPETVEAPRRTIECLSELLRYQLYSPDSPVELSREIEAMEKYIELCRLRASRRLSLKSELKSETVSGLRIYPLLLMPLIENAFKHVGGDYRIAIALTVSGACITLRVSNTTGTGQSTAGPDSGLGLANLRRRLELLYPSAHSLTLVRRQDEFVATLTINPLPCPEKSPVS